jgi:hypothetical protein
MLLNSRKQMLLATMLLPTAWTGSAGAADKPNIVVIWGDDIGWFNISAYNRGMMTYRTPNIDRIASEGILFTDAIWPKQLYGRPCGIHYGSEPLSYRTS